MFCLERNKGGLSDPDRDGDGFGKALLKTCSARIIVEMGMLSLLYRTWYRSHRVSSLRRNILNLVGIKPVHETLFGAVETASILMRSRWLRLMCKFRTNAN